MTDTTETRLSDQQLARIEALKAAQPLVRTSKGAFGGVEPPELNDLVDLAVFILEGKHPMADHYAMLAQRSTDTAEEPDVRDA
jgi:hypothetical protein